MPSYEFGGPTSVIGMSCFCAHLLCTVPQSCFASFSPSGILQENELLEKCLIYST